MDGAVGQKNIFKAHVDEIAAHLSVASPEVYAQIAAAYGFADAGEIEAKRIELASHFAQVAQATAEEEPQPYSQYVSRHSIVGVVQSALATVFAEAPSLQGYGDLNPLWLTTKIEQLGFAFKNFFHEIHDGVSGQRPLMVSFLQAFKDLRLERADYPSGVPCRDMPMFAAFAETWAVCIYILHDTVAPIPPATR